MHLPTVNVRFEAEDLKRKKKDNMNTCRIRVKRVVILVVIVFAVASTYLLIARRRKPDIVSEEVSGNDGVQLMQNQRILVESRPKFKGLNVPRMPPGKSFGLFQNRGVGGFGQNNINADQNFRHAVPDEAKFGENVGANGGYDQANQGGREGEANQAQRDQQWEMERRLQEQQDLIRQQAQALQKLQDQLQGGQQQQANAPGRDTNFQRQQTTPSPQQFQGYFQQEGKLPERNFPQGQGNFPNKQDNFPPRNFLQESAHEPQRLFPYGTIQERQRNFQHAPIPQQQDSNKQVADAARLFESDRNKAVPGQIAVNAQPPQQEEKKAEPADDKDADSGPVDAEKLFEKDRQKGLRKPGMFPYNKFDGRRHPWNAPGHPEGKRDLDDFGQNVNELDQIRSHSDQDLEKRVVDQAWTIPRPGNPMKRLENNALANFFSGMKDKNYKLDNFQEEGQMGDRYDEENELDAFRDENQENGFRIYEHGNDVNMLDDIQNEDGYDNTQDDEDDDMGVDTREGNYALNSFVSKSPSDAQFPLGNRAPEGALTNQMVNPDAHEHYDPVHKHDDSEVHENAEGVGNEKAKSGPRIHVYDLSQPPNGSFDCVEMRISQFSRKICVHPQEKDKEQSKNIILHGKWEEFEVELLRRTLKADGSLCLVDIGAGLGVYTVAALMEGRQVLAVEPFKDNYRLFHKTVQINSGTNLVTLVTDALGEKPGIGRLIYPLHDMGAVYVKPLELTQVRADLVSSLVNIITLDDLVTVTSLRRAILKLDTHGDENLILKGAEKFFRDIDIPYVFMHWLPKQIPAVFLEVAARLQQMGYEPVDDPTGRPLTEQELSHDANFIVWRKKRTI